MAEDKIVQSKNVKPGWDLWEFRSGQGIVGDTKGTMVIYADNPENKNIDINSSDSMIVISGQESDKNIQTQVVFPSNNFTTINYKNTVDTPVQTVVPLNSNGSNIVTGSTAKPEIPTTNVPTQSFKQKQELELADLLPQQEFYFSSLYTGSIELTSVGNYVGYSTGPTILLNSALAPSNQEGGQYYTGATNKCGLVGSFSYTFRDIADIIIDNIEGGYFDQSMFNDGRLNPNPATVQTYSKSGETLFGLDFKAGAFYEYFGWINENGTPSTTKKAKPNSPEYKFWSLVHEQKPNGPLNKWDWGYKPNGQLYTDLKDLAAKIMENQYNSFSKNLSTESKKLIASNGKLQLNAIYWAWNGIGWFQNLFIPKFNEHVKTDKDPESLFRKAVNDRLSSSNGLIRTSGKHIGELGGLNCTSKGIPKPSSKPTFSKLPNKKEFKSDFAPDFNKPLTSQTSVSTSQSNFLKSLKQ